MIKNRVTSLALVVVINLIAAVSNGGQLRVAVDPGHDVGNPGGEGFCSEKIMNLNVGYSLAGWLTYDPRFAVKMTRDSDSPHVSFLQREQAALQFQADILVSIHHDGGTTAQTFALVDATTCCQCITPSSGIPSNPNTCPQRPIWQSSYKLANHLMRGIGRNFSARYGLPFQGKSDCTADNVCFIADAGTMAGYPIFRSTDRLQILYQSPRPAVLIEAAPLCSPPPDTSICLQYPYGQMIRGLCLANLDFEDQEARGVYAGLLLYRESLTSAMFRDFGAFGTTAYCQTINERGTTAIELLGYETDVDFPDNAEEIATLSPSGGDGIVASYVTSVTGSYALLQWRELDADGHMTYSDPFTAENSQPSGWEDAYAVPQESITGWGEGETVTLADTALTIQPEALPGDLVCADIVVYSQSAALAAPITSQISQDSGNKRVKTIIGANNSAATMRESLLVAIAINRAWNSQATDEMREYPVSPGPEVYLVSSAKPSNESVQYVQFQSPDTVCGSGKCRSDMLLYDLDLDGMPDGPLSRVSVETVGEASAAATTAAQYNGRVNVDPTRSAQFIAGDYFDNAVHSEVSAIMARVAASYAGGGFYSGPALRRTDHLNSSGYVSVPDDDIAVRAEFKKRFTAGCTEVFGFGGHTGTDVLPANFLPGNPTELGLTRRAIGWFPGCAMHAVWTNAYGSGTGRTLLNYTAGPTSATTFAASVSDCDAGYDIHHGLIAEYVAKERTKETTTPRTVARITYDALKAFVKDYPGFSDYARLVSVWGSYVVPPQYASYCGASATILKNKVTLCPGGDADSLRIAVALADCGTLTLDSVFMVRRNVPGNVQFWDANGRSRDTLRANRWDPLVPGQCLIEWTRGSGCGVDSFDIFAGGRRIAEKVPTRITTFDLNNKCIGASDQYDSLDAWTRSFCTYPCYSCGDFTWSGGVSTGDWVMARAHSCEAHNKPRRVIYPNGGQSLYLGHWPTIQWVAGGGDSGFVSAKLVRDAGGTAVELTGETADDGEEQLLIPVTVPQASDYRLVLQHWAGRGPNRRRIGADTSDVAFEVGQSGGGCPYVDVRGEGGWEVENTILSRSLSGEFSYDGYRFKGAPKDVGGKVIIRLRENETELTTVDDVRLVAVDHAPDITVLGAGSDVVAGRRVPATRVSTNTGQNITELVTGGSGWWGGPGDTLLVEIAGTRRGFGAQAVEDEGGGMMGGDPKEQELRYEPRGGDGIAAANRTDADWLDRSGVVIQRPDGVGGWIDAGRWYPRQLSDEVYVPALGRGMSRLVFRGHHRITFLGFLVRSPGAVYAQTLALASSSHSRLGVVAAQVFDGAGTITLGTGDTLTLAFAAQPLRDSLTRTYVLAVKGVYTTPVASKRLTPNGKVPSRYALQQNVPNPLRTGTSIGFDLPRDGRVDIEVFDLLGRRVRTLVAGWMPAGSHVVEWDLRSDDGRRMASGVYPYRMRAGAFRKDRKLVLVP